MSADLRSDHRLSGRELFLIFLFWTSLAVLTAVNRLLDPRGFGFPGVSPAGPILLGFLEFWLWAAFTPLIFWLSSHLSVKRYRWIVRVALLVGVGLAIAVAIYLLLDLARMEIFELPRRRGPAAWTPFRQLGRFRIINQLLVYFAVLAAGYAREYFLRDQARGRQAATLQAQLADARLAALRMQLNPHFLFNTLHAVSALVERDPPGVRRMIARLSELLRQTIDRKATDEVTLAEELGLLRRYIEIMEVRFQGRLRVEMDVADEALPALVPNLVLQPIVENALEHGAARAAGEGRIVIAARRDGDRLRLSVRDNGPGIAGQAESGVGLANTRARLGELYGTDAALTLGAAEGGGALVEIVLPFRTGGTDG